MPHYWGVGKLLPEDQFADFKAPELSIPRSPGHYLEWIRACKGGPAALSNFDYAVPLTEMVLLGNIALRTGKTIRYDAKNAQAIDSPPGRRTDPSRISQGLDTLRKRGISISCNRRQEL